MTERAYDNPKFVEDMVRDVAAVLNKDERIERYVVESENFESIRQPFGLRADEKDRKKWCLTRGVPRCCFYSWRGLRPQQNDKTFVRMAIVSG